MKNILKVKNACKYFGDLKAVDKLNFEVEENIIFGVAGPNGAGKTTMFNIITGIPFQPTSGEILFQDENITNLPGHKICHMGIARTFQREAIFKSLTVLENVELGWVYGQSKSKNNNSICTSVIDALELVGIEKEIYHKNASHLPLFDQKKLMLASAIATNPKILFLDEPASGLNHSEIDETIDLIRNINDKGVTIVVIEHILSLLVKLADKLMILNEGKKLIEDQPEKVMNDDRVIEVYLGGGSKNAQKNLRDK